MPIFDPFKSVEYIYEDNPRFKENVPPWFNDGSSWSDRYITIVSDGTVAVTFRDATDNVWTYEWDPGDRVVRMWVGDYRSHDLRRPEEGEEPMSFISQAQEAPPTPLGERPIGEVFGEAGQKTYNPPDLSDQKVGDVLGGAAKTYVPPDEPGYVPLPPDKPISEFQPKTYVPPEDVQPDLHNGPFIKHLGRARPDTDQSTPSPPPPSGGAGGSEAKQTQAQQWAEELTRYEQAQGPQDSAGASDQPVPQPDGDGDGIPNEYGDGPDLDGNGLPDEIGINPDSLRPGYPNTPSPGDDGEGIPGLGVPYQDYIPFSPMVQDPTTGQWRNAEPGEIPGAEEGEADQTPLGYSGKFGEFGHTGNFDNTAPSDEGEYEKQEVPPLQFGNTGNLQNALDATLFNPEAPGPTLSTDLFDPTAQGPTLDTGLIPELANSPHVVEALNQDPDLAATLARDPGMIEQLKQDASLSYGERTGILQGDGGFTDQGLTDPSLTEQEDMPDQDVDYTM